VRNRLKRIGAIMSLVALAAMPAAASPAGQWEIETGSQRYDVTLCGDGTELCATLIWLGKGDDTAKNRPYLNTMVIDHAPLIRPNQWRGELHLYGRTATGTITQVSDDVVQLKGCYFFVICRTYMMHRLK